MHKRFVAAETVLGSPLRNLAYILIFVATVTVLATLAYIAAGWSFSDASYMVTLTVFSVGYGEVRPIDTPYLHVVTMGTMLLGCTGMILLTSSLVQVLTVFQLRQLLGTDRMTSKIDKLTGHVIICGYGRIGVMLAKELAAGGVPLVVIERGAERLAEVEAAGYLGISGDATEEEVLFAAGIERAKVLATVLPDDAANVFITLSARNIAPALEIIARGEAPTTERKLRRAGADQVVQPTHIGAERIARMILYPHSQDLSGDDRLGAARAEITMLGLDLELVPVARGAVVCGITVEEAERRSVGSFFVAQINRANGEILARPARDERIEEGDQVLIVVRNSAATAKALFTRRSEVRAGRNRF
jgi:voltage-gated potassium channel